MEKPEIREIETDNGDETFQRILEYLNSLCKIYDSFRWWRRMSWYTFCFFGSIVLYDLFVMPGIARMASLSTSILDVFHVMNQIEIIGSFLLLCFGIGKTIRLYILWKQEAENPLVIRRKPYE